MPKHWPQPDFFPAVISFASKQLSSSGCLTAWQYKHCLAHGKSGNKFSYGANCFWWKQGQRSDYSDHEIALKTRQKMTNIRKESSMLLVGREGGIRAQHWTSLIAYYLTACWKTRSCSPLSYCSPCLPQLNSLTPSSVLVLALISPVDPNF